MVQTKSVRNMMAIRRVFFVFLGVYLLTLANCRKHEGEDKPSWAKKDIRDYNEADLERLLDQWEQIFISSRAILDIKKYLWEEDEEPLEPDELPEHLRPQPQIQFDPSAVTDPEQLLRASKKGRSLMMFVKVKSKYSKTQVEELTKLWQGSLHNNHLQAERYMVDDQRAIFMFGDGSQAWEAKDFLVQQEELEDCTIDNRVYPGLLTPQGKEEQKEKRNKEKKSNKEKQHLKKTEL